jgi:hypothetical protein
MKTHVHLRQYLAVFFLEWEMYETKGSRESQNTRFMSSIVFPEVVPFKGYCGKIWYIHIGHKWKNNAVHALSIPEN